MGRGGRLGIVDDTLDGPQHRLTDAFPAPRAPRLPAQPSGSSRPVRGTSCAELSGFGNAGNVMRQFHRVVGGDKEDDNNL